MGKGHGGYTEYQKSYEDSRKQKVIDKGSIFVAERYIDMGYESVFRGRRSTPLYDLTIKTSDDTQYVKNIEVKEVSSKSPSQIAIRIKGAKEQISPGDTVAIVLPNHKNDSEGVAFATVGVDEARRKGYILGPVEVWFSDKTKIEF